MVEWHAGHTAIVIFSSLVFIGVLVVMLYFLCQNKQQEDGNEEISDLPCSVRIDLDAEAPPAKKVAVEGEMTAEEMTWRSHGSRADSPPPPGAKLAADKREQATLIEAQSSVFREINNEYASLVAKWYRHKHRSQTLECAEKLGSIGLAIEGGESMQTFVNPLLISKVHAGTAVSEATLTKKSGEELPAGEDRLQPGDLLLKITTDATKKQYGGDPVTGAEPLCSALNEDDSWAVFTQAHVMTAVGPVGDTFAGSNVTLWVVRDKTYKALWSKALKQYGAGGGTTDPHADIPRILISQVLSFTENPLAIDAETFKRTFPVNSDEYLLKATFTMQSQAEEANRMRQMKLEALGWTPESQDGSGRWQEGPGGFNLQVYHEFHTDEDKAKEHVQRHFTTETLDHNGTHEVQAQVHASMGLPPPSEEKTKAVFQDADVHDSGSVSFGSFFHFIKEEVSDAILEVEDVGRQILSESPAGHNTPVDGV